MLKYIFTAIAIVGICLLYSRGIFISDSHAIHALEVQGYSDVRIISHSNFFFLGGSTGDAAKFVAKAKNPAGQEVTVWVFSGYPFKGCTIRTP